MRDPTGDVYFSANGFTWTPLNFFNICLSNGLPSWRMQIGGQRKAVLKLETGEWCGDATAQRYATFEAAVQAEEATLVGPFDRHKKFRNKIRHTLQARIQTPILDGFSIELASLRGTLDCDLANGNGVK